MHPCSRTGQGKTLAFVLPIVERLLADNTGTARKQHGRLPRVIVLAPTRELAKQVQLWSSFLAPTHVRMTLDSNMSLT